MTITIEGRTFTLGEQYRLLPGVTTVGGGGVNLGTATLVEVSEDNDPRGNVNVRALDGDIVGRTQWVDPAFLAPLDQPMFDFGPLDAAFAEKVRTVGIRWRNGWVWDAGEPGRDIQAEKWQVALDALHDMASASRAGTLPDFGSTREAGGFFWSLVTTLSSERGVTWRRQYGADNVACDDMGEWLASQRGLIAGLSAPTPVAPAPYRWPVGTERVTAYNIETLALCEVVEVFRDTSSHILDADATSHRALTIGVLDAQYRPVTPQDRLFITTSSQDGRSDPAGTELRFRARRMNTGHGHPSINVSRPDREGGSGWSSLRYLRIEPAAQPLSGTYATTSSTVEERKVTTIVHEGREYVLKDDVIADFTLAREILHKGADANGLCGVYDKVGREVDESTLLFKMGTRPRRRRMRGTVTIEVSYDLITTGTYSTDEEAVAGITAEIVPHLPMPERAPNPDNAYAWRVSHPVVNNTHNDIA